MEETLTAVQTYFVIHGIRSSKAERILFELNHERTRYRGLSRFCHESENLLRTSAIVHSGTNLYRNSAVTSFFSHHPDPVMILSPDPEIDQTICSLSQAIAIVSMCLDACIIIGKGFCFVQSEVYRQGQNKYLLAFTEKLPFPLNEKS